MVELPTPVHRDGSHVRRFTPRNALNIARQAVAPMLAMFVAKDPGLGGSVAMDLREADRAIEQRANRQHSALLRSLALAGVFEVLDDRPVADPEDDQNLEVGSAARCPENAVALAIDERGMRICPDVAHCGDPPDSLKLETAD